MNRNLIIAILVITGCVLIPGCISSEKPQITPVGNEPTEKMTETPTQTPISAVNTEISREVIAMPPPELALTVSARKDPIDNLITVSFDGGAGQELVKSMTVQATLSSGEKITRELDIKKGSEIVLNGTHGSDKIKTVASYMNGQKFMISDQVLSSDRPTISETIATKTPVSVSPAKDEGIYAEEVQQPPNSLGIMVDAEKDPIYRVITTTFRGGHGQSMVSSVTVRTILSSGETVTKELQNTIGSTTEVQGTDGTDKVQVVVRFKNGESYKIYENTFKSRG